MAKLQRRGIGKFHIDRIMLRDEHLRRGFEGLEAAYDKLWEDAEKCIGDHENSWFWALMLRTTSSLMAPLVRDLTRKMEESVATAMMLWNAGKLSSGEMGEWAYGHFAKWFAEELLPMHDERCVKSDAGLLEELNEYIRRSMEGDGLHPITLKYICTEDYHRSLRNLMTDELLPTVEVKIKQLVPEGMKDSRIPFLRRRRLRRGLDSFYDLKDAEGSCRGDFISDVLIGEKLVLEHANSVFHALARSIVAEELYLMS